MERISLRRVVFFRSILVTREIVFSMVRFQTGIAVCFPDGSTYNARSLEPSRAMSLSFLLAFLTTAYLNLFFLCKFAVFALLKSLIYFGPFSMLLFI